MRRTCLLSILLALSVPVFGAQLDPALTGTSIERGGPPSAALPETLTLGLQIDEYLGASFMGGQPVFDPRGLPADNPEGLLAIDVSDLMMVPLAPGARPAYIDVATWHTRAPIRTQAVIANPGRRDLWVRIRAGDRAILEWGMGGRIRRDRIERRENEDGAWRWVKMWTGPVAAGEHRFEVRNVTGLGMAIDGFVLLPEGADAPEGAIGDLPAARASGQPIRLTTRVTTLPAVDGLVSLRLTGPNDGLRAAWSVSLDGGVTWREAPGGRLDGIEVPDGPLTIAARAELSAPAVAPDAEDNAPIALPEGIELIARPNPDAWVSIRNDFLHVLIDRATGRLVRLRDAQNGRDLLWSDAPAPLFSIDLKRQGQAEWLRYTDERAMLVSLVEGQRGTDHEQAEGLGPGVADRVAGAEAEPARLTDVRLESGADGAQSAVLTWRVEQAVQLVVRIRLDETGQSLWTASIENDHAELDVIRLEFPRFASMRLGASGYDDVQRRFQTFNQNAPRPGMAPIHDAIYPGAVAMPWETLHDTQGGFSRIARDRRAANTEFAASADVRLGDTLTVATRKRDRVKAGGGRQSWEYAVAVHPGAWHWAADRYREWTLGHFERPVYPDWFATNDGFYFLAQMNLNAPYTDYPKYAEQALRIGLNHVQVWGQFTGAGYGCCGPYWQPSPRYGTLEEFVEGIAAARAKGVRMGFYFLHDRVDLFHPLGSHIYGFIDKDEYPPGTEFPSHEMVERIQWVGDPAGKALAYPLNDEQWDDYRRRILAHQENPAENEAPRRWHPVDISDPEWWEYLRRWAVDKYAGDWGAAGIYNDVLATGSARESFDPRKGHHGESIAAAGKTALARVVVESARERGFDEYFHLAEGSGDLASQWCAMANMGIYRFQTEMFRYTFPDVVVFEGTAGQGSRNLRAVRGAAWLNGNRYDLRTSNNEAALIIAARASVRPWIYRGRFLDTLGVELAVAARARLFRRLDAEADGAAITLFNPLGDEGEARVAKRYAGDVRRGVVIGYRGGMTPLDLRDDGDAVAFAVPQDTYAVAVLASRADVGSGLIVHPVVERVPTVRAVRVNVANLTDGAIAGRIVPRNFEPYHAPEPKDFVCASGDVVPVVFDLEGGVGAFARAAFDVVVDGQVVKTEEVSIFPFFEDPSFEVTGNDEQHVATGRRSLRIDPKEGFNAHRPAFYLEPDRRYRIRVAVRRSEEGRGVRFVRLVHRIDHRFDRQAVARPQGFGAWETLDMTFETPSNFISTFMYMYNNNSTSPVWYDDVRVEDLGPAGE